MEEALKRVKSHERRHGRHGDPRAAETHLQSAVLPGSPRQVQHTRTDPSDEHRSLSPSLLLSAFVSLMERCGTPKRFWIW